MPRPLREIIRHLRIAIANQSVHATLIQTEDLTRLCDAAQGKGKGTRKPPTRKGPRPPTRRAA